MCSRPVRIEKADNALKRAIKLSIALVISGVCLYFSARNIELAKIWADAQSLRVEYFFLSPIGMLIGVSLRAWRWHLVLQRESKFDFSNTFWSTFIGYLGNNILPARAGEVLRSVVLGLSTGVRKALVLATALTERVLDAGILLILAFTMMKFTVELPAAIQNSWAVIFPVVIALLILAFAAPLMQSFWLKVIHSLPLVGEGIKKRIEALVIGLLDGIRVFHNFRLMFAFSGLSFVIWLVEAVGLLFLARAFGAELTLPQTTIFIAALGFASSVPSTPGYVGVFQAIAVLLLPVFGVSEHRAFLVVSVQQLLLLLITAMFGVTGWFIMQRRIGAQRLEAELAAAKEN